MKRALALLTMFVCCAATPRTPSVPVPPERAVATHHSLALADGRRIAYTSNAGTLLLHDERTNAPVASMFYTAYTLDGADVTRRPVTFLYNGGPGSSTIWLRMASVGPVRVHLPNAQAAGNAPYTYGDNEYSLLDKSDLVFVDAIGTGYSRVVGRGKGSEFWGIDEDVRAFAQFIHNYLSRNDRWNSPKFLFGESYGTTRSANLVNYLQEQGVAINGVVLLSSILDFGGAYTQPGGVDQEYLDFFPTEAATASYHNRAPNKAANLDAFVQSARVFTEGEYASALMKGSNISSAEFDRIAQRIHDFTGLDVNYIKQSNLRIPPGRFEQELLRGSDEVVGRLDGRYVGYDLDQLADAQEYDPSDVGMSSAIVAAFHDYVGRELHFRSATQYYPTHYDVVGREWNFRRGGRAAKGPGGTTVAPDLKEALIKNPHLRVLAANGYFDFATPFFATEYTIAHLGLPAAIQSHISLTYYDSGHMVYLNPSSLVKFHNDLDHFYDTTLNQ